MDKEPLVYRDSCSKIKPKTCFWKEGAPIYWSPSNLFCQKLKTFFWAESTPSQMDWVLLNLICVISKKYLRRTSLFWKKIFDGLQYIRAWAPIYRSPFFQKTCFWYYFRTWITVNQRFLVHLLDPHVTHKTWFYQNFPSSFLSRMLEFFGGLQYIRSRLQYIGAPSSSWLFINFTIGSAAVLWLSTYSFNLSVNDARVQQFWWANPSTFNLCYGFISVGGYCCDFWLHHRYVVNNLVINFYMR